MTDFSPQSSDKLQGPLDQFAPKVLYRASVELLPTTAWGGGYRTTYTKDIGFLNITNIIPTIELYRGGSTDLSGPYAKCPYFDMDSSGSVSEFVIPYISTGSAKGTGNTVTFNIYYWSKTGVRFYFYYQLLSVPAADRNLTIFPYLGSFST